MIFKRRIAVDSYTAELNPSKQGTTALPHKTLHHTLNASPNQRGCISKDPLS